MSTFTKKQLFDAAHEAVAHSNTPLMMLVETIIDLKEHKEKATDPASKLFLDVQINQQLGSFMIANMTFFMRCLAGDDVMGEFLAYIQEEKDVHITQPDTTGAQ